MHRDGRPHESEAGDVEQGVEGEGLRGKEADRTYGGVETQHDSHIRRLCFHLVLLSRVYIISRPL